MTGSGHPKVSFTRRLAVFLVPLLLVSLALPSYVWAATHIRTITVEAQSGSLTYGIAGSAAFNVRFTTNGSGATSATFTVAGLPAGAAASWNPANPIDIVANSSTVLTITTTATTPSGVYPITVSGDGRTGAAQTLTIGAVPQTITVTTPAPATAAYNASFAVAATASSGLPVSYSASGACANVGALFTMTSGTGACTVRYDQAGNGGYSAAAQVTEMVTATQAQAVVVLSGLTQTYNGSPRAVIVTTAPPGLTVVSVTYAGSATAPTNVGSYAVLASLSNPNYQAADAAGTLVIQRAAPSMSLTSNANNPRVNEQVTFTAHLPTDATGMVTFTASANSPSTLCINVALALGTNEKIAICTTSVLSAGDHAITAAYSGDTNYLPRSATLSQRVRPTTLALISRLDAYADGARVYVEWETIAEVGTAGFYLYRQDDSGQFVTVRPDLLQAFVDAPLGATYRLLDPIAQPGNIYSYKLVEIEHDGSQLAHGPYTVTANPENRAALEPGQPAFSRARHAPAPAIVGLGAPSAQIAPAFSPGGIASPIAELVGGLVSSILGLISALLGGV